MASPPCLWASQGSSFPLPHRTALLQARPRLLLPVQSLVCLAAFGLALPLAISLFPQMSEVSRGLQGRAGRGDVGSFINKHLSHADALALCKALWLEGQMAQALTTAAEGQAVNTMMKQGTAKEVQGGLGWEKSGCMWEETTDPTGPGGKWHFPGIWRLGWSWPGEKWVGGHMAWDQLM